MPETAIALPTSEIEIEGLPGSHEIQVLQTMALSAAKSNFFKRLGSTEGVFTVMLMARELGIPPMQAITGGIHLIDGRPEISARQINALIRKAGHSMQIVENTNKTCKITGKRKDTGEEHTEEYSMDDAKLAGLAGRTNWRQHPKSMLFARCISQLGRFLFPDVIGNAYVEGEISDEKAEPKVVAIGTPEPAEPVEPEAQIVEAEVAEEPTTEAGEDVKADAAAETTPPSPAPTPTPEPVTEFEFSGKKFKTAGIVEETFKIIAEYQRKGNGSQQKLLAFMKERGIPRLSEMDEDQGQEFLLYADLMDADRLRKRFFALMAESKINKDKAKQYYKTTHSLETFKDVTAEQMSKIIKDFQESSETPETMKGLKKLINSVKLEK